MLEGSPNSHPPLSVKDIHAGFYGDSGGGVTPNRRLESQKTPTDESLGNGEVPFFYTYI